MTDAIFKNKKQKRQFDNWIAGICAGIIFPLLGIIFFLFFWGGGDISTYFQEFFDFNSPRSMERSSKIISLSMIANLIPFYYFLNRKYYTGTKGIIATMFIWALIIFVYKFILQ